MAKKTIRSRCLALANKAVDLAITELVRIDGHQIARRLSDRELLVDILRGDCGKKEDPAKYVKKRLVGEDSAYRFKEDIVDRGVRVGKIRPTDLVTTGH